MSAKPIRPSSDTRPVVNGSVWKFLLNDAGLINTVLTSTGLRDTPVPFLYDQHWALFSVAFVNAFAVIPFNTLVFRAALMTIDPEVFEAAGVDIPDDTTWTWDDLIETATKITEATPDGTFGSTDGER